MKGQCVENPLLEYAEPIIFLMEPFFSGDFGCGLKQSYSADILEAFSKFDKQLLCHEMPEEIIDFSIIENVSVKFACW